MSTQIAIAFSQAYPTAEATNQACITIKNQVRAPQFDLVIVFASSSYANEEALRIIHTALKPRRLVGSSAAGIILSEGAFTSGIGILAVNSDTIDFGITNSRPVLESNLRDAGFEWGRRISADCKSQHQACLIFTDYTLPNNALFIRGIQEVLGLGSPLVGAVSSCDLKKIKTCQFYQNQVLTNSTVGLLIAGVNATIGYKHGFKPLGKPRTITSSNNNTIHTIDDKPAMHIYEDFLGSDFETLSKKPFSPYSIMYPLGIYIEDHKQYLLKNAVDILRDGSIVCQGEVPQGAEVHLMIGNRDSCRQSASEAAGQVKDALGGRQAKLIIVIESFARYKILKNSAKVEIQAIKDVLGYTTPMIGMYAFGEVVPLMNGRSIGGPHTQNESILILAID